MGLVQLGEEWPANTCEEVSKKMEPSSSLMCMAGELKATAVN